MCPLLECVRLFGFAAVGRKVTTDSVTHLSFRLLQRSRFRAHVGAAQEALLIWSCSRGFSQRWWRLLELRTFCFFLLLLPFYSSHVYSGNLSSSLFIPICLSSCIRSSFSLIILEFPSLNSSNTSVPAVASAVLTGACSLLWASLALQSPCGPLVIRRNPHVHSVFGSTPPPRQYHQ